MSIIDNCITKILSNDTDNSFPILLYLDFEKELSPELIFNYSNNLVNDNPILKTGIIKQNNNFFFKNINNFNINDHVIIKYMEKDKFNDTIYNILNTSFKHNSFLILCCIDKTTNKTRIYFKINHAYTDGYKLSNMLTKSILKKDIIPDFKRNTSFFKTIYHYIIGTIVLLVMNIKIFIKLLFNTTSKHNTNNTNNGETDYIICKPFSLNKIKQVVKNNNSNVNDFLYSIMIKTDRLYTKKNRIIQTCSPINVSKLLYTNNMCPIFNSIDNSYDNNTLLQHVHNTFDNFKYSLFIPVLSWLINNFTPYINIDILSFLYDSIIYNSDYIYSNIIGPPIEEINKHTDINLVNMHFLTTSKSNEIIFNIVSSNDNINIICTFKKGKIQDKKRFEKCIYKAYNSLINIDNIGFA